VEKYVDLITNGLDLLSFLLVTPEIAKMVAPALAGCGKTPCPNRHRFDSVLAYCGDVANDAWQGP